MAFRTGLPGPIQSLFEDYGKSSNLTLVTPVLNASSNWIFLHLLQASLKERTVSESQDVVVLFSLMRSWGFWKECALKMGVDLERTKTKGRLRFVDGLTVPSSPSKTNQKPEGSGLPEDRGKNEALRNLSASIDEARAAMPNGSKLILLLDQIDGLLAMSPDLRAVDIEAQLSIWREVCTSIVLSIAADMPFIHHPTTKLELDHTSLLVSVAHEATQTVSVRPLDTGATREVSGVLRITSTEVSDEWLYHIKKDFSIKAWGRGEHV